MKIFFFPFLVVAVLTVQSQNIEAIKFSELQNKILYADAPLTVFNFWATWCGPCVKEMPHFDNLETENEDIKVYFVSLDFKQDFERVRKFVAKKDLKSEVLYLDEKDPNSYMRKVNKDWSGAIPASLFVTDLGKTYFFEKAFTKEELQKTVEKYLN